MNVEFESVMKTIDTDMYSVRDYGTFKVIRIGFIRIIPNNNGQLGEPLSNFYNVVLDEEDVPIDWPDVRVCSATGAYVREGYLSFENDKDNAEYHTFDDCFYYKSYNAGTMETESMQGAAHYLGSIIYRVRLH